MCPAHPRVSGENLKAYMGIVCIWGSSPRERGKLYVLNVKSW